ncbi:MAG: hypothetical protein Q8R96_11635 [Bacteroidota bacterium]|nr:hypothetical protein [Bacteroidota bacterium]
MSNKILNNPLVKNLVKSYLPDMIGSLGEGEKALIEYIELLPLLEGETHAVLFTEIETDTDTGHKTLYLVVGAFSGRTFSRLIEAKPAREFLKTMIETFFKK